MPLILPVVDLTGASVGQSGSLDLTPIAGPAGISYATFGQSVLRLHNESNCGLQCTLPVSAQSFYLPAGGWQDAYPKAGDNELDYEVLYTLSGPGVTLLLATYYYPGEAVPALTQLGNSPIGGGNVQTNFSQLTNTGNNPGSSVINVQPNDASAPTITATNSGNFVVSGDNAGVLTTLLQLIPGASPAVKLAAASVLTSVLGNLQINGMLFVGDTPGNNTVFEARTNTASRVAMQAIAASGQTADIVQILAGSPTFAKLAWFDANGGINTASKASIDNGLLATDGLGTWKTGLVPVSFAGTSGTANLYQWYRGSVQCTLVIFKAFSTAVSSFTLALPSAYTAGAFVRVGNIGNFALEFEHSAAVQNINVFTGLTSGGGSVANQGGIFAYSLGEVPHAFDTLNFASSGTESNITGFALIEGE